MNVDKIKGLYPPIEIEVIPIVSQNRKFVFISDRPRAIKKFVYVKPARVRVVKTKVEKTKPIISAFRLFRKEVFRLTELVAHLIPGVDKRGFRDHHIDHRKSIWHCWKNGVSATEAASLENLRMLPYRENMVKGKKCE